jgi:hypothetical protein
VRGSNVSPFGAIPVNNLTGLYLGPQWTGTVDAGGSLNVNGNVSVLGGKLVSSGGGVLKLGTAGKADVLTFGSGYPGASPDLEMNVDITNDDPGGGLPPVKVTMNVAGPGTLNDTVTNQGTLNFVNGSFTVSGPNISNTSWGTVNIQGSETFGGANFFFANAGLVEQNGPPGTATTASSFLNQGWLQIYSGTLHLQSTLPTQSQLAGSFAPETQLSGGATLWVDSPYTVLAGWVDGNGTVQGVLDNGDPTGRQAGAGNIHPGFLTNHGQANADGTVGSGGQLTVTGDFQQTSSGILWIDLTASGGGSGMGQLNVTGNASLAGQANVVRGSNCTPGVGMGNFTFVTWGGFGGTFDEVVIENNSWQTPDGQWHSFDWLKQDTDYTLLVT